MTDFEEQRQNDYQRGMGMGLELALGVINKTANVEFDGIAEVALYLYDPELYAHFKKPAEESGKAPT
jgi:hypothetical protein